MEFVEKIKQMCIRDRIVVAQAARVVIEPEKQHQRHQVEHHELHAGHLRK